MNKKGFTVVELITSFTLASIIMIILFNVILIMKDNLSKVNAMTNTLVEKDNLSYNINKRLKEKELSSITTCGDGDKCFLFTYSDSTSDKLVYSSTDKTITFNNYTFSITDDMSVESPTITEHYDTMSSTTYNGYFILNIPITVDGKDYSIKINKHFNTDSVMVDVGNYYRDNNGNMYTPVEYLESTGTHYIDTGVTWNTSIQRIEGEVLFTNYQTGGGLNISPWVKEGNNYYGLSLKNSDSIPAGRFLIGNNYTNFQNIYYLNTKYYYVIDRNDAYINGNRVATVNNSSNSSATMYEFASHRDGIANIFEYKQLYCLKIYNNDTLVRDYIPVIDSSSRPCLFDKVSRECYYNQGTGEFLYG